ncbi:MAG TPA: hypothetical protein VEY51_11890 [Chondromyces sp.]|nr:hypothetical protein [Chondromyces sp.]
MIMGEPIMPIEINEATDLINKETLLKRVNERDAFDVQLNPREGDRLQLTFSCQGENGIGMIHYGFEYRNGKWEEEDYEVFDWKRKHEEEDFGEVKYGPYLNI